MSPGEHGALRDTWILGEGRYLDGAEGWSAACLPPTLTPIPRPPTPPESLFPEILFLHDSLKNLSAGSLLFMNPGHLGQENGFISENGKCFSWASCTSLPINISLLLCPGRKPKPCVRVHCWHTCAVEGAILSTWTQLALLTCLYSPIYGNLLFVPTLPLVS